MKRMFFIIGTAMLLLASCAGSGESVAFTVARNYFVKNNAAVPSDMKLRTQADFNRCFGMATTMGPEGKPTEIDFSRNFAIAKVMPVTDTATELEPKSLKSDGHGKLTLKSSMKTGSKMSYSIQPFYIIVVDRKYIGCDVSEAE